MEKFKKREEALSIIWDEREKGVTKSEIICKRCQEKIGEDLCAELERDGLVRIAGDTVKFTDEGERLARDITRRQRLAERLLIDVLEVNRHEMDLSACELEHVISKEVEESICTLLGHPKECPHGLPIPAGNCCAKAKGSLESIVLPLSKFTPGEAGNIVYLLTRDHPEIHKLMSFGVLPGSRISVHQVYPSFVIQIDHTQLALEESVAKNIYVRKVK